MKSLMLNCRFLDISIPEHPEKESSLMEIDVIVDYGSGSYNTGLIETFRNGSARSCDAHACPHLCDGRFASIVGSLSKQSYP